MEIITKWFNDNPWLNILFLGLSILSIILAFYFYYKSIKEKKPVYNSKTISLFHASPIISKKLEIKYNGNLVDTLSLTKFAFWNAGRETIRKQDIALKSPFLITTGTEVNIFEVEIIHQNTTNNFSVEKLDEHTIKIDFDFIDFNDGIIINVFHNNFKNTRFSISSTFIGAKKLAHGIDKAQLLDKFEFLSEPVNYLMNHKIFLLRILGGILLLPTFFLILIPLILLSPIDIIRNKMNIPTDKKFLLKE